MCRAPAATVTTEPMTSRSAQRVSRASALRSLGAYANVFAIESFIDEVAATAGVDPVAYRLRYLHDPRARTVIERAMAKFGSGNRPKRDGIGQGVGFARYKGVGAY